MLPLTSDIYIAHNIIWYAVHHTTAQQKISCHHGGQIVPPPLLMNRASDPLHTLNPLHCSIHQGVVEKMVRFVCFFDFFTAIFTNHFYNSRAVIPPISAVGYLIPQINFCTHRLHYLLAFLYPIGCCKKAVRIGLVLIFYNDFFSQFLQFTCCHLWNLG